MTTKKWLIGNMLFTAAVIYFTFFAILHSAETIHLPDDGKDHLYDYFLIQLLLLNMIPHNLAKAYLYKKMIGWRFRRVKTFDTALFVCQAILVMTTWVLGFTVFNAGMLLKAIPEAHFFMSIVSLMLYCYLFYWSIIGTIVVIVCTVMALIWVWKLPSWYR